MRRAAEAELRLQLTNRDAGRQRCAIIRFMPDDARGPDGKKDAPLHVEERIVYLDEVDQPVQLTVKEGRNRLVIVLRPSPYLFSV